MVRSPPLLAYFSNVSKSGDDVSLSSFGIVLLIFRDDIAKYCACIAMCSNLLRTYVLYTKDVARHE